ncbi:hypothetical protein [Methylomonas albis]|uniref:Secreted protein n=1 Tax=Methylomonas albis TaxID=1854563 RepID=A0ABR9D6S0_9GAMM|nr:hypothetical protein [Methylomonas albis]MBD9358814.1 hypothetical protein [Methylomonas albis]CAD6882278.1 hypothetical protein [Methylomonas albis]
MNLKPIRLKIFILIVSGIGLPVSSHAETRPSLAGLQSQINALQAQITQADNACSCWTPQELSDLLTKAEWFPSVMTENGSTTTPSPFQCTKNYSSKISSGEHLKSISASIVYPVPMGQPNIHTGVSVGVSALEGGVAECTKTVNGITYVNGIKINQGDNAHPSILDQTEIQQCYAQIMAVGKTLPDCDFNPITIP